jgi:hypothetical protein
MKFVIALVMLITPLFCWGLEHIVQPASSSPTVDGVVLETLDVENFTYLKLKTKESEVWAAVINSRISKGAHVTLENVTVMTNFESKSLKRTFPTILFATLASSGSAKSGSLGIDKYMSFAYPGLNGTKENSSPKTSKTGADEKIPKAQGQGAVTVEEVITKSAALKGKSVLLSGKVVKYNSGIMGKNWIHLRDGSGSDEAKTNDILVTSTEPMQMGDLVTIKGMVATDKDFGAGYSYKVMIEEATLQK